MDQNTAIVIIVVVFFVFLAFILRSGIKKEIESSELDDKYDKYERSNYFYKYTEKKYKDEE